MKRLLLGMSFLFLMVIAKAQPWTYDFGTTAASFNSSTASTSFLPAPATGGGTSRVRVGTNPGSIATVNPGLAILGSGAELQIASNTGSTSTTKFSVYDYTAGKTGYVKFNVAFSGGTNGVYKFSLGDGATFSDNNPMTNAQVFAGIEWSLGASNAVTYKVLNNTTIGTTGITGSTTLFTQSTTTSYLVEVYANNTTSSTSYLKAGTLYTLANATWDLWVDGTRVGPGLAKGALAADANIDSYAFNHQASATTPGILYLDDIEYSNALPPVPNGTWLGTTSNSWSTASNWMGGIPSASTDVVIPAGAANNPSNFAAPSTISSLTIASGATLTNSSVLTISNALTNAGTINFGTINVAGAVANTGSVIGNGTITLNGSSAQTITGTGTFANLNINNANGVTIASGATKVAGTLTPQSGVLTTNGNLTLVSTLNSSTGTAKVAAIDGVTNTGSISGNVTVERYIPAGKRGFRFLTPGVTTASTIKANWQEGATSSTANPVANYGTHITGSTVDQTNGFDGTVSGNPSLFQFDNATQAWNAGIANTNATSLAAGNAYRILIRGNRTFDLTTTSATNTATTLRATGTLVTGTVTMNSTGVAATAGMPLLSPAVSGYSLIGNPYASPVSWASVQGSSTDLTGYYYIWDPTLGTRGAYVSCFTDGTKSNPSSNVTTDIQPGQAIFVQNISTLTTGPSLVFHETDKTFSNTDVFRTQTGSSNLSAQLYLTSNVAINNAQDAVTAVFNSNFSNAVNDDDASKLVNQDENIAIQRGNSLMSIERRNLPVSPSDTMQFKVWQMTQNSYTLRVTASNFDAGMDAYLQDSYTGNETLLNLNGATDINFTTTAVAATMAADRFRIVFRASSTLPVTITNLRAYQKNAAIQVEWNTANELNLGSYEVEKSVDGSSFIKAGTIAAIGSSSYNWLDAAPAAGNNYYRIKAISKNGSAQYTQIVNVKIGKDKNTFTVIGNPVKNKTVALQLEGVEKGSYTITVYNNMGQQVATKTIVHAGGSATDALPLGNVATGSYQLSIMGNNGVKVVKNILVD